MAKRNAKKQADFASKAEYRAWLKRSKASKKGWATRKKRELPKKIAKARKQVRNAKVALGKKPKKARHKKRSVSQKDAELKKLRKEVKRLNHKIKNTLDTRGWLPMNPPEKTRKDGTLAVESSRLRHTPEADSIYRYLKRADRKSKAELIRVARWIAHENNVSLQEVYTLFYSP